MRSRRFRDGSIELRTRRISYRPVLITLEGEVPLSNETSLDPGDFSSLLDLVREVLGIERTGESRDEVVELVRAGRLLDAAVLVRRRDGLSLSEAILRVKAIQSGLSGQDTPPRVPGDE